MNSTVLRVSYQMRCSSRFIFSRVIASSAPNGSSISSTAGSWTSARQIDARCCMPPESCHGRFPAKSDSPVIASSAFAFGRYSVRDSRRMSICSSTLSSTVRHASSTGLWNTMPTSSGGPFTGTPFSMMLPADAGSRPATIFSSVDLPQPDGPTIAMNSPSPMANVSGFSDRTGPSAVR